MKRMLRGIVLTAVLIFGLPLNAHAARLLVPVGEVIGLQLQDGTVTVAAFDDVLGAGAKAAGLRIGDEILNVEGAAVHSAADVKAALERCADTAEVTVRRGGKHHSLRLPALATAEGRKLGIYLRQGVAGIGTVTWYDPATNVFGTLGHGVNCRSGLLQLKEGSAYTARVQGVVRGKSGDPGQLRGEAGAVCGQLLRNTPQGVFGINPGGWPGEPLPVAAFSEVKTGSAHIRSTVGDMGVREYSVEILKIYPQDRPDGRHFLLRVTDPALLETTGGIIQGMSGSPIIQDGKIVGAVTHVLVNDPTRGYGIFIENMLDAAG